MTSDHPHPAFGLRSHWTLFLLLMVYTLSFTDQQIISILIEPIKEEFHVSDAAMGMLAGLAFALFYGVLAIPAGRYADRANRRNFIALCCGVWSLFTAFCGMATSYVWLFLSRAGVATGEAGGIAPSLSLIADHYPPQQRGRAMSVFMLAPQLGILIGLGAGGWIAQHYGWRDAFLWMGPPGIIVALLLRFTGAEPRRGFWDATPVPQVRESLWHAIRSMASSRAFMRLLIAGLLMTFAGFGIGIWTPAFLVRTYHMSLVSAGALLGFMGGLCALVGTLVGGWLCDHLGRRDPRWRVGVPLLGSVIALPFALLFFSLPTHAALALGTLTVPWAVFAYAVFAFTTVWWTGPVFAVLAELIGPQRRATVMALFQLGITLFGAGLGPTVIGVVSDHLVPAYGDESLRWALDLVVAISYALGIWAFAAALKAYAAHHRALAPQAAPAG